PALTQQEALSDVAQFVLGYPASSRDVVRRVTEDYRWAVATAGPVLRETAEPFQSVRWSGFGG
ncbi:MAG: hypothetical protein WBK99_10010, partial [Solirubrobacterales bacterium]